MTILLILLWTLVIETYATPSINLPINAQVPPIARVNQLFQFVFSESTFTSSSGNVEYAFSNSPAWLALESASRTLSGLPTTGDAGSITVDLVASDDTGALIMPVTLVVSSDPGPGLGIPVEDQLPAYGSFSSPNSILLEPSSHLSLSFSPNTFTNTSSDTVYYALCANNTPLPSWIQFDSTKLAFSGTSPNEILPPDVSESFEIELTASNVVGFADAIVMFMIVLERHLLVFKDSIQIFNVTVGSPVNISALRSNLLLDGQEVNKSAITQVSAATPSWLSLDSRTLVLSGMAPENATDQNFTLSVTDTYGDSASTVVILQVAKSSSTALLNPVGAANATIGTLFVYLLNSAVNAAGAKVTVNLGTASTWLAYDDQARVIKGYPPNDLNPQQIIINITARQGEETQSEILTIAIQSADQAKGSATLTVPISATPGSSESSRATAATSKSPAHAQRGWIAAAVILPLAACLGMGYLFICCWKRRRRGPKRTYIDDSSKSSKHYVLQLENEQKTHSWSGEAAMSGALLSRRASSGISLAPRISWTLLGEATKQDSQSRLPKASSAERSQRPDSWQTYAANIRNIAQPKTKPTSDFSRIPEEKSPQETNKVGSMNQIVLPKTAESRINTTEISPLKKRTQRPRANSQMSLGSSGQLYSQIIGGFGHGRQNPGRGHGSMLLGNRVGSRRRGPQPTGPSGFGPVDRSWRNVKDSQSTSEWTDTTGESSSQGVDYKVKDYHVRQPTIWPVWPSQSISKQVPNSSVSTAPPRPIPKSARLRRSENPFLSGGSIYSRYFSHQSASINTPRWKDPRRRVSATRHSNGAESYGPSTLDKHRTGHSYSRSSSIQPPSHPSSPSYSGLVNQRLDRFNSSIPRVIDISQGFSNSDTRGSSLSMDSRFESAVPSQTQSMYDYALEDDPFGEHHSDEGRASRRDYCSGPLRTHSLDSEDVRPGLSAAMLASRRESGPLQELSRLTWRTEDDNVGGDGGTIRSEDRGSSVNVINVRGTRGQRLGQQMGLRQGDPANTSMRGEIKRSESSSFL